MKKVFKEAAYWLAAFCLVFILYGIGNELGEWYMKVLKKTGGLITAKEIINCHVVGPVMAVATLIVSIWARYELWDHEK